MDRVIKLTDRENALLTLCITPGSYSMALCRKAFGRALITCPVERAAVALELSIRGYDGIGRVQSAHGELGTAAAADSTLLDCVAGRARRAAQ